MNSKRVNACKKYFGKAMCTGQSKEGKHESQENRVPIFGLKSRYYLSESQGNNGGINEYCDLG